jgi:hypothetical protein
MTKNQTLTLIAAAILCTNLTGCGTIPSYEQLGNGYVMATYIRTSWEPPAMRFELQYRKGLRTVVIWPSLYAVREVVKDDVVVFVANTAIEPPLSDEPRATMERLFAVKAPELPMDITDEVLWRWSKESGADFVKLLKTASIVYAKQNDNAVEFHFVDGSHKDIIPTLDWNQISDVMREVKEKGVVRKDRVQGTSYIEKEFKPETTDK